MDQQTDVAANESSPEFRVQQIKSRRLEIAATLAEWKRAFFVEGTERAFTDRLTLEAEEAALAFELHTIRGAAVQAKAQRREQLNASLLSTLLRLLVSRGMGDVISEAKLHSGYVDAA